MENQTNQKPGDPKQTKQVFGILLFEAGFEFVFLIAVPLGAGIWLGKWLDAKYHQNFFVIIGILLGLTVSGMAIYRRILDYKNILEQKVKK